MQYVKVDLGGRAYTYGYDGPSRLAAGDWVWVPGNSVHRWPQSAIVIRTMEGPDFDGPITLIICKAFRP